MGLSLLRRRKSKAGGKRAGLLSRIPLTAGAFALEVGQPNGHPLDGAGVQVKANHTGHVVMQGRTDPFGTFTVGLPTGRYTVLITADGLLPTHLTVDVDAGRQSHFQVTLEHSRPLEPPQPGIWLFDPPHTAIRFIARHVGMANVHGRFTRFDGGVRVGERPEDSYAECTIDAASITTGNNTRDTHLRSADFLDVENYPYIQFVSERFQRHAGNRWTVHGSLTLHGISRTISLETDYLGSVNGGYGEELRCAAKARTELHREDYTLNWRSMLARGIAIVGPTIQLELDIQVMFRCDETPTPPE
ncbi:MULTISPECIES: YceI family protein [unclassified Streptomyces]|uniref:YceI family protein n=1 Tax=unclassified Streptomyces TaxID=2593676 RepID=UPI002E7A6150|nr:YceI family protein [Streptomyces sp. JV176]MEE1799424.1 YceI family protein [Streptomyces sp. JV176]